MDEQEIEMTFANIKEQIDGISVKIHELDVRLTKVETFVSKLPTR